MLCVHELSIFRRLLLCHDRESHLTCVKARFNHYNLPQLASVSPLSPPPISSPPATLNCYLTPSAMLLFSLRNFHLIIPLSLLLPPAFHA